MNLIWNFAEVTNNPRWKGLTWAMLPLHASGVAACTYHFFYNPASLQFLVDTQAGLTLLGNTCVAIAAYRIAISNGWTLSELNPLPKSSTDPDGIISDSLAVMPLNTVESDATVASLAGKLLALTLVTSYVVKYGELGLDLPFSPNGFVGTAMICSVPALTTAYFLNKSKIENGEEGFTLPFLNSDGDDKPKMSMDDVKKYGVAGTVAYVLTELAFWAVAFPVASTALYQTSGHWPDVFNDPTDRATVLGFIFAGANIARLAVPLRFGVALALAPWVDENIISRLSGGGGEEEI
mmetsp:Transcript_36473/g.36712  ORF Transcript_36473/g.36712 Transcript_36473/m.36712 type:complete len:294 (-) Transcript_36473:389-1270(-)